MALPMGRGVSRIRTPALIRDYLTGQGPFAEDPPEELAERFTKGAYVATIHQRIKQHIKQLSKELRFNYQWPRSHSFNARIQQLLLLGLIVKTGEAAPENVEPQLRGAGRLGTAGGFSKKLWIRMAPGADTRPEWADVMGYIDRYYAERALTEGRPPPNIRPKRGELAIVIQAPETPEQLRPRRRRAAIAAISEPTPELLETIQRLEEQRQLLQRAAETLSISEVNANRFENIGRIIGEFHAQVLRVYRRTPFPDLPESLELLQNCVRNLQLEIEMTARRVQAVNFCRNAARLVAEAISRPLQPPEAAPAVEAAPPVVTPPRRTRRAPAAAEEAEVVDQITARWQAVVDRITGWSRPNSTNAENLLDRFVQETTEAFPDIREDDLNDLISDVRSNLSSYQEIERSDYDNSDEYQQARANAWEEFVNALDVDFSDLGESE